ncbi:MAG: hypothetical protein M3O61_16060, partial [Gemmatimonadota bacterium]|nr:hypothetical protein [Gemmatimonadota bacterium]
FDMSLDLAQLAATAVASAIGAAATAAIGYRYAMARFRKERAFDRRLAWHETAVRDLVDGAGKLFRAVNSTRNPHSAVERDAAWRSAGDALGRLLSLETGAELYASNEAYHAIATAAQDIRATAKAAEHVARHEATSGEAEVGQRELGRSLHMYEIAAKLMLHAASRLAKDVRTSLELDELSRDWRLYDDELTEHLADIETRGLGEPESSAAPKPPVGRAAPTT